MDDPFDDPDMSAEMVELLGVRYVCSTIDCDWFGYKFNRDELCPKCGRMPIDRWAEHARHIKEGYL
jgi:hypothetical protein